MSRVFSSHLSWTRSPVAFHETTFSSVLKCDLHLQKDVRVHLTLSDASRTQEDITANNTMSVQQMWVSNQQEGESGPLPVHDKCLQMMQLHSVCCTSSFVSLTLPRRVCTLKGPGDAETSL